MVLSVMARSNLFELESALNDFILQTKVRFFGKIRKRILESKNGFHVFCGRNPKTDHESKVSTLEKDTSDQI